jgi:fibronectin-binding autotransporter adhesin
LNGASGTLSALTFGGTATSNAIVNSNAVTTSNLAVDIPIDVSVPVSIGGNVNATKTGIGNLTLVGSVQPAAAGTGLINISAGKLTITSGTPVSPHMNFFVAGAAALNFGSFGNNNTDANAFGTITSVGGPITVTGGSGDLAENQLVLTGASVDLTGTTNSWWHFRNAGAGITINASSTTVTFTGPASGSRFQNDSGANLPINVDAGTTASGIDLDAGILFSSSGGNTTFEKLGRGTMRLLNTGNTANFVVTAGTLQADDVYSGTNGFGALGTGSLTLNGGTFGYGAAFDSIMTKPIALTANGGKVAVINAANTLSITGSITGPGGLTVAGPGTFSLQGTTYTYSGNTVITGGTLSIAASATIPNSPVIIVGTTPASTAVFDVSATGQFILGPTQKIQGSGKVVGNFSIGNGAVIAPGNSIGLGPYAKNPRER